MIVLGTIIIVVGAILSLGNRSGIFPTFPFLGTIVMIIGGVIAVAGGA